MEKKNNPTYTQVINLVNNLVALVPTKLDGNGEPLWKTLIENSKGSAFHATTDSGENMNLRHGFYDSLKFSVTSLHIGSSSQSIHFLTKFIRLTVSQLKSLTPFAYPQNLFIYRRSTLFEVCSRVIY
jgi:hypothetical protein